MTNASAKSRTLWNREECCMWWRRKACPERKALRCSFCNTLQDTGAILVGLGRSGNDDSRNDSETDDSPQVPHRDLLVGEAHP